MEKDITLLSRVTVNHIFLGQFEAFRANLLSLRKRKPELALAILQKIVSEGGRIDGILWSRTLSTPSDLTWLSALELSNFNRTTSTWNFDANLVRLKAEFILLIQIVASAVSGIAQPLSPDLEYDFKGDISDRDKEILYSMNKMMQYGLERLKSDADYGSPSSKEITQIGESDLQSLWNKFIEFADIFNSLCWNIQRQLHWFETCELDLAISMSPENNECLVPCSPEVDALLLIQKQVQMAHLTALRERIIEDDIFGAFFHIRFLHLDYGVLETEYKSNLQDIIKNIWLQNVNYGEKWKKSQDKMALLYAEALSSKCIPLVRLIQLIQDEIFLDEIEKHRASNTNSMLLPIQKYLVTLKSLSSNGTKADQNIAIRSCRTDLYHYSRLSSVHIFECVMNAVLSAVKNEQLQVASDVLSLFPLLQPLVAVLGWDLLSGRTASRRKLMQLLWTSKSHVLRMEEYPLYGKKNDEISCVEYQCDLLCFNLDLARFVSCINSGQPWSSKASLLYFKKEQVLDTQECGNLDTFVENFVLERLSVETPLRVLFDVVPGIKFQDAIELLNLQPIASPADELKRMQDIELIRMRYALESVVLALGAMEESLDKGMESHFHLAIWYLKDMEIHLEAINNITRKIYVICIISSLLQMDETSVKPTLVASSSSSCFPNSHELLYFTNLFEGGCKTISFTGLLLDMLQHSIPEMDVRVEPWLSSDISAAGRQALEWRVSSVQKFIEDWKWRLSILQRLEPLSKYKWSWKEVFTILRAAPSKLLNLCLQREKYDLGEEAVHRFSLPAEDKAVLDLNEWVAGSFKRVSVEDVVTHAAEGTSSAFQSLQFSSLRSQLGPLAAILLCIDVAVASSKSVDVCKVLLGQSRDMLSEIYPGNSPKIGSLYWKQIQEVAIISVIRRVLQRLHGLVEQDNAFALQELFVGDLVICSSTEAGRQGQRQRALLILHQMIGDAHKGRRQFLSGKLHNLARAVVDEDSDGNFLKAEGLYSDKKPLNFEKSTVLGLGLKVLKSEASITPTENDNELTSYAIQDNEKRFYGSLTLKASTYLSSFIIYIATIGDIVDGIDTTHDFNFFSLIYERPKDLLIRLVFERGSTDAAGKVADIMGVDFVHEVIAACVPPVLPPRSRHGWACVPVLPSFSSMNLEKRVPSANSSLHGSSLHAQCNLLYPLQLNVVKHLANLSPVRAVLACVFGSNILSTGTESCISGSLNDAFVHTADAERLFYEFALDQSERFPTLNRWIQMQSNLHRVSESTISTRSDSEVFVAMPEIKLSGKRRRDPENDAESDNDNMTGPLSTLDLNIHDSITSEARQDSSTTDYVEGNSDAFISFDWENEAPYEKAVERLITEGKLMDALALSDRCLHNGASDQLLQLLIDQYEKNPMTGQLHGYGSHNASNTWQYCIRLKDKQLAASLALKYLNNWELNAAIDVLTMCCCHLSPNDPILNEVLQKRQALQRYNHILFADDRYNNWQEVEADCKEDPEGLALRLAGKGAVSAALEVAESASLSVSLRRELQGRQLVKLLTADPLSGGGPAEASRFISSLRDSDDALPAAVGAMQLLPDLRSKKLLVHFFLKRQVANMPEADVSRLNSWALGLGVLTLLPLPSQQRCSSLHEHPQLILEVLLMMKQLESALLILKEFPSLRDDKLILTYASKAISINVNPTSREPHLSVSTLRPKPKPKPKPTIPTRSNFTQSIGNLQKEARRAFSWAPRDEKKSTHLDSFRKRKGPGLLPSEKDSLEAMSVIHEERIYSADGQERLPFVSAAEEWVLSGDSIKDAVVRSSHKYETAPDITLFKALLALCSTDLVSAKGAFELCVSQMKTVLSSKNLPLNASMETIGRVYHATETYVQALSYSKSQLRKLAGKYDYSSSFDKSRDADDTSSDATSSSNISQYADEFSVLLGNVEIWLGRAELLQSLLGSGIVASLDDIDHKDSSSHLRDRLIKDERYSMAVYTCKKCKVDGFPVWIAWGKALIQMEHYTQARIKFKQALQLYKGDPSSVVIEIINMIEGGPPVDVSSVQSMYEHLEKSVPTILDDSLSADSYLNVLYIPSTFPRSERSRSHQFSLISQFSSHSRVEGPHSHLDSVKYGECIYYLQEYARLQMLVFMFRHGHYADACSLFFPVCGVPNPPLPSPHATNAPSASPQRPDALATDYGTIDDLCDLCIGYGAMSELVDVISARSSSSLSQDGNVNQYIASALARICNYCETHRHFNYLYKFQVLRGDNIASGLCCLQLFMNSSSQEESVRHLEHAKVHFDEGLSARYRTVETTKILPKIARGKSASNKLTEEELIKLSARVGIQVDVVKSLNDNEGPQWKYSLFGNPSDPETFRRRCVVAETLAEKHFDLAFQVIYQFNLPAVDIYASVAASLAERKRGGQLTEFLKNIKGTIDEDDWDQVLGAAINVYAHKHKERPDRLIDMLISSHRKVLACVICGRLKSAFQIASRSGSVADVQYVAHQASYSNALPVLDMCKQWLGQYM